MNKAIPIDALVQQLQQYEVPITAGTSMDEMQQALAVFINHLLLHDANRLVTLLYRVDVDEAKLKTLLKENDHADASHIIADAIMQRQLQKIATRKNFTMPPPGDEEKW